MSGTPAAGHGQPAPPAAPPRPGTPSYPPGSRRAPPRLAARHLPRGAGAPGSCAPARPRPPGQPRTITPGKRTRRAGAGLPLLLGGADQHLVDRDVPRPGHDVGDRVGDVLGLHPLPELAADAMEHLGPVV